MSLYAQYLLERTNDKIIESGDRGFVTYRLINDKQMYILDIFVIPEYRHRGLATELANLACNEARLHGCTEALGTVIPSCKNATASIKVLIAYGMTVLSSSNDFIVFRKDL